MEERYLVYTLPIDGQQWDQLCFPLLHECMNPYTSYKLVEAMLPVYITHVSLETTTLEVESNAGP